MLLVAAAVMMGNAFAAEPVTVLGKIKDMSLRVYGFVETDVITDTTQSFNEEQGNNLVTKREAISAATGLPTGVDNYGGRHARTQMSIRNSRLGFDLGMPKTDWGLESNGVIELDMLGNQAANTAPANTAFATQSERDFFNNPTVRVRHAYLNLTYKDWNVKVGQFWSLLGWQPYYFPGEAVVQPAVGQLYRRFAQMRLTNTQTIMDSWTVETAADMAKPAQMNSGVPEFHGGLRVASTKLKAASIGGAGTSMVGLSAGISGALIPVRTDIGKANGGAIAVDLALPIIPSKDGKDRSNNLVVMGEFVDGRGLGGLEYSGLSLGVAGVTAAAIGQTGNVTAGSAVDSGIAGINRDGNVELVHYRTFRAHAQYSLNPQWALSGGFAQAEGRNLDQFSRTATGAQLAATYGLVPKIQFGYVSLAYDPLAWLRVGAEWNHTVDTYNDPVNRTAINNRFQLSTYLTF